MRKLLCFLAFWFLAFAPQAQAQFPDQRQYAPSTGGSANAQTVAIPNYNLNVGVVVRFLASASNTGAMTLSVNGSSAETVLKIGGTGLTALTGGEVQANAVAQVVWDGAQFELLNDAVTGSSSGSATPGYLPVTAAGIAMAPGGGDNSPLLATLMSAINPTANANGGGQVVFPPVFGANQTAYAFKNPFRISRGGTYSCGGSAPRNSYISLVFDAGIDGVVFDDSATAIDGGSSLGADLTGCSVYSLGHGTAVATNGSTAVTSVSTPGVVGLAGQPWAVGDGILAYPTLDVATNYNGWVGGSSYTATISGTSLITSNVVAGTTGPAIGQPVSGVSAGLVGFLGTITPGSGGTPGVYTSVSLTGGTGSGAIATITINGDGTVHAGGVVITTAGINYTVADSLSASPGSISGFSVLVRTTNSGSVNVTAGTIIIAGSGTSWTVNKSQTVASEPMYDPLIGGTTLTVTQTPSFILGTPDLGAVTIGHEIQTALATSQITSAANVTANITGSGGVGTYTLSSSQLANYQTLYEFGQPYITPPGTTVTAVGSGTLTLSNAAVMSQGTSARSITTWRFPGPNSVNANSQQYAITTTSGSPSITVVSGPRPLEPGDVIWSDAFGFLPSIVSVTSQAFPQTAVVRNILLTSDSNATVNHAAGSGAMWVVPVGIKHRVQSRSHKNYTNGFGFGESAQCTAGTPNLNCTASFIQEDSFEQSLCGYISAGDNTSATTLLNMEGIHNYIADFCELATLGSTYLNDNSNSAEEGNTQVGLVNNCANQNSSVTIGDYIGFASFPSCMGAAGLGVPTVYTPNNFLIIAPASSSPSDMILLNGGNTPDCWSFGTAITRAFNIDCSGNIYSFSMNNTANNSYALSYNSAIGWYPLTVNSSASQVALAFTQGGTTPYIGYQGDGVGYPIYPRGILLSGNQNIAIAGGTPPERLFRALATKPINTNGLIGDVAFNTAALLGGTIGWVETTNSSATFAPFGPVSFSTTATDWVGTAFRSGVSSNTDFTGRITLSGGTATYTLLEAYSSAPNCWTQDVTTPALASSVSESTTVLTFTGTGTDVLKYGCSGRN